jgi:hypothetical protein
MEHGGEPIPDLTAIPQDDWVRLLTPLSAAAREMAINLAKPRADPLAIGELILSLPKPGMAPPRPSGPRRRAERQVGFRLTDAQYAELELAASDLEVRPAGLARTFVIEGARRHNYEARQRAGS